MIDKLDNITKSDLEYIATKMYESVEDMDFRDYLELKEENIRDLTHALEVLQATTKEDLNSYTSVLYFFIIKKYLE